MVRSSIEIERGVSDVFAFLNDFENFPRVVSNLRAVTDYQDGRAHWEAYTPSGQLVEWDTVITKYVPRSVIAWESTEGSEAQMTGLVRFTVLSPTRTQVDLEMTYTPPHSGVHDAIRTLFGPDREKRLREDLSHARYYLESLVPRESSASEDTTPPTSEDTGDIASPDSTGDERSPT